MKKPTVFFLALFCLTTFSVNAQDPFFIHFYNNRSYYNAALTGMRGATTLSIKYKEQWRSSGVVPFQTMAASFEESVPCGWFDYGLHYYGDQEGDGILQTHQLGASFAAAVPLSVDRQKGASNLRFGGAFLFAHRQIQFDQLIFSDQLNEKYGIRDRLGMLNPTAFVAPNSGRSPTYLTPSVGGLYRYVKGSAGSNMLNGGFLNSFMVGFSYHNLLVLGKNENFGHISSLLNSQYQTPERLTFFGEAEWAWPFRKRNLFISVSPLLLYQKQKNLDYLEAGIKFGYSRNLAFGLYFHLNSSSDQGNNTSWFNLLLEFGGIVVKGTHNDHRIDLGIAYADNFSGIQNVVGPILEFSFSYHINTSSFCKIVGREDEIPYTNGPHCPVSGRGKIYDDLW